MNALSPGELPTAAQLNAAGADAGRVMDATRDDLERAIGAAHDKKTRVALAAQVKALDQLHRDYFGEGE